MGYKIRFKTEALAQLDALYQYTPEQGAEVGRLVLQRVHAVVVNLSLFPKLAHMTDEWDVRKLVICKTGLIAFYAGDEMQSPSPHIARAAK